MCSRSNAQHRIFYVYVKLCDPKLLEHSYMYYSLRERSRNICMYVYICERHKQRAAGQLANVFGDGGGTVYDGEDKPTTSYPLPLWVSTVEPTVRVRETSLFVAEWGVKKPRKSSSLSSSVAMSEKGVEICVA